MFKHFLLVAVILLLSGCAARPADRELTTSDVAILNQEPANAATTLMESPAPAPFPARFEIYTLGTRRTFTDQRYHNLSTKVYIERARPDHVVVATTGTTWNDFFQTLPISLSESCLVTGTKQTFCSDDKHTLRFSINAVVTPDALGREIKPNDFLRVEYGQN